jgi:hypothetical protein
MNPSKILDHLRREPFRPIRIHLSDGAAYDVRHPEFAAVSRTEIAIALEPAEGALPEQMVYCDPLHITRIQPIDKAKKDGSKRRKS